MLGEIFFRFMKVKQGYDSKYIEKKLYWGNKPHELVVQIKKYLPQGSSVLDLGCGEGQNASYLAKNGFRVTAVDVSQPGIEKVEATAKLNNLQIKTEVADAVNYIKKSDIFDAIVCMNILQFIPVGKIRRVIKRLKDKTSIGGYNVIASFVASDSEQKQKAISSGRYFFDEEELRSFYSDWDIIKYDEKWSKWETHNEPKHRHYVVRLIARKLK